MKFCQKTTTNEVSNILRKANNVAIFAHTRPDGDTIGACVALRLALQKLGKNAEIFCDTELTSSFDNFLESKSIKKQFSGKYDLFVAVDCGSISRLGEFGCLYDKFQYTLTIDHHGGEFYSKYNLLRETASTCEIMLQVIEQMGVQIDSRMATYLYMGLCTDTGNFAHSNTNKAVFDVASKLVELGADIQLVNRVFFKDVSLAKTKLIGVALSRIRTYFDDKLTIVYATKADFDKLGLNAMATEGLVQYAVNVDTAVIGVSICEHAQNVYKISMRSKNFDVRQICEEFGGGGHLNASGCMISGFFEDVIGKIVFTVGRYLC